MLLFPLCLLERVKNIGEFLGISAFVDDPQCVLGIMRFCAGAPKMVFSLRCNSPSDV